MIRLIIILVAVFILLSIFGSMLKRYRLRQTSQNKKSSDPGNSKNSKDKDDDNIVDAKYEEIK